MFTGLANRAEFRNACIALALTQDELTVLVGADSTMRRPFSLQDLTSLSNEQQQNIAYLMGIYDRAHLLHPGRERNWLRTAGDDVFFEGLTPIAFILAGAPHALERLFRHLGAQCHSGENVGDTKADARPD